MAIALGWLIGYTCNKQQGSASPWEIINGNGYRAQLPWTYPLTQNHYLRKMILK